MIAREVRLFLIALQFLTRIPVKSFEAFDPAWLDRAAKYFPLVGALVGTIAAFVLLATSVFAPQPLPILLAIAAGVAVTGAFHEDGLADAVDGLGGGATRERRLEIMKDSRIGTYGAVTLGLVLAIKVAALSALDPMMAAVSLLSAHAAARLAAVVCLRMFDYVGDEGAAKVKPLATAATNGELAIAMVFGLAPAIVLLPLDAWLTAMIVGAAAALCLAAAARRLIGGYTGDVLGGVEQVFEAGFLLGAAAIISGPG